MEGCTRVHERWALQNGVSGDELDAIGLLLTGWGVFNVVEGVIDHQLLGIHHVRDDLGGPIGWDLGFLALGVLMILGGRLLARSGDEIAAEDNARRAARETSA